MRLKVKQLVALGTAVATRVARPLCMCYVYVLPGVALQAADEMAAMQIIAAR